MLYAQKISTTNDSNGNPRRGWWLSDENGTLIGFVDYGHHGSFQREIADLSESAVELVPCSVTPADYKQAAAIGWSPDRVVTIGCMPIYGADPDSWLAYDGPIPSQCDLMPAGRGVRITAKQAAARLARGLTCAVYCYAEGRGSNGLARKGRQHWLVTRI